MTHWEVDPLSEYPTLHHLFQLPGDGSRQSLLCALELISSQIQQPFEWLPMESPKYLSNKRSVVVKKMNEVCVMRITLGILPKNDESSVQK